MSEVPNGKSPAYELLNAEDPDAILRIMIALNVCEADESITQVTKAGEGNMNLALRVQTNRRSIIVKQSRPWVEKYPSLDAPEERIIAETAFYHAITAAEDVCAATPAVVAADSSLRLLVLEDLGTASDYASLYAGQTVPEQVDAVFQQAIDWVTRLHQSDLSGVQEIGCLPLRELNHQHIFSIPLNDPPPIDLDQVCPGLTAASRPLCTDDSVSHAMQQLGEIYLAGGDGPLLHGDYYPGSWLKTDAGFRVIDPEFCFCGPAEYDLGVLAAHWIFCGNQASMATIDRVCAESNGENSRKLILGFAGAELVRRLIGVGQLPLNADLERRKAWLECGVNFLKQSL